MKTIKIRFVGSYKHGNDPTPEKYRMQVKHWYGWRYVLSCVEGGFGDSFCQHATYTTKSELLLYLYVKYKTTASFLRIIEYPEIKKY